MHNFRELRIWKKSIEISVKIYQVTKSFPKEETFGLTSQMRRCATSIPSNIAEGCGRNTVKDFDHFLAIATGSSYELETQIILADKIGYILPEQSLILVNELHEIQKMIYNFKQGLVK